MTGTVFGKEVGASAMAVSRWENGDNEPDGKHYAKMGNIAVNPASRIYFWERAGVDIEVLAHTHIPAHRKPQVEDGHPLQQKPYIVNKKKRAVD